MKLAIELSNRGPYERVYIEDLQADDILPNVGDTLTWDGNSYVVKSRIIDCDDEVVVILAAV